MPEVNDNPIAHREDGSPIFDNTPTVVCIAMRNGEDKIITVRRNNEPGRGLLGLPGGYHMRGETWQEAGARELFEETGFVVDPEFIMMIDEPVTDEYGNNLIFASYFGEHFAGADLPVRDPSFVLPDEVQEVVLLDDPGDVIDWAFPRHYDILVELVTEALAEMQAA